MKQHIVSASVLGFLATVCTAASSLGAGDEVQDGSSEAAAPPNDTSGHTVLFAAQFARYGGREGWFAIPVLCVDASRQFVAAPETCAASLVGDLLLEGAADSEQVPAVAPLVDVPDRDARGLLLGREPQARLLAHSTSPTSAGLPPRPACSVGADDVLVPGVGSAELARVGLDSGESAEAVELLGQPWAADESVEGDFDGDGHRDRLVSRRFWVGGDDGTECDVLLGVWGPAGDGATIVDLTCEEPVRFNVSGRLGPYNLALSSCWDVDQDGQIELWLATGHDSQRGYEFVEIRERRLERAGGSIWLGD